MRRTGWLSLPAVALAAAIVVPSVRAQSTYESQTPGDVAFPQQMRECDILQRRWDQYFQQIGQAHDRCLNAYSGKGYPSDPRSGCTVAKCGIYHNPRDQHPEAKVAIDQCRARVREIEKQEREANQRLQEERARLQQSVDAARAAADAVTRTSPPDTSAFDTGGSGQPHDTGGGGNPLASLWASRANSDSATVLPTLQPSTLIDRGIDLERAWDSFESAGAMFAPLRQAYDAATSVDGDVWSGALVPGIRDSLRVPSFSSIANAARDPERSSSNSWVRLAEEGFVEPMMRGYDMMTTEMAHAGIQRIIDTPAGPSFLFSVDRGLSGGTAVYAGFQRAMAQLDYAFGAFDRGYNSAEFDRMTDPRDVGLAIALEYCRACRTAVEFTNRVRIGTEYFFRAFGE